MGRVSSASRTTEIVAGRDTVRFAWLLATLVAALALPPLFHGVGLGIPSVRLGLAVVLAASLGLLGRHRRTFWIGLGLVLPTLALDWASLLLASWWISLVASCGTIAFLGLVVATIVDALLRAERVTADTILGGICVYLLLGLLWVSAYTLTENLHPGSLLLNGAALTDTLPEPFRFTQVLYFSFVTLTTLGYGDIIPATPTARALASAEAIVGQLYVAIFVARLVGLHLAHARERH